jgi:hypothetical protein
MRPSKRPPRDIVEDVAEEQPIEEPVVDERVVEEPVVDEPGTVPAHRKRAVSEPEPIRLTGNGSARPRHGSGVPGADVDHEIPAKAPSPRPSPTWPIRRAEGSHRIGEWH